MAKSASWNDDIVKEFLKHVTEEAKKDVGCVGGFKTAQWKRILDKFNEASKLNYDKDQLNSKVSELKSKYKIFKDLINNSGFGWDEATKLPTGLEKVFRSTS